MSLRSLIVENNVQIKAFLLKSAVLRWRHTSANHRKEQIKMARPETTSLAILYTPTGIPLKTLRGLVNRF